MKISFIPHLPEVIPYRVKWLNDPKVTRHLGTSGSTTLEEQNNWFEKYQNDDTRQFFTITESGNPIGVVGLTKIDRETNKAEIFIMIGEENFRGQGIGKLAMQHIIKFAQTDLGIVELSLGVHPDNLAAIRCYQSVGFIAGNKLDEGEEIEMRLIENKS